MNNIKFHYLYRDQSNYKKWGSIVFSNDAELILDTLTTKLQDHFLTDGLFIAHQIRVPEVFLSADYGITRDDHCYHEFDVLEAVTEHPTDVYARSIQEFIFEIEQEAHHGWVAFDPLDRVVKN